MRYFLIAFLLIFSCTLMGQTIGYMRYDTVKIFKLGGSAELVLQNRTRDTLGYLYNIGGGITEFRKVPPGAVAWGGITGTLASQTDLAAALAAKQPQDADLTAIAGLTPANNDILQYKSGAWTNRTLLQYKTDLNLNLVQNTALSTWPGTTNITTVGTITTGTWNGAPIPTSRGGAPPGGAAGNVLKKISSTDYDYSWQPDTTGGGSGVWGSITGTLSSQSDLQTVLNAKQPLDADLSTIAGLTPTNDDFMQYKAGAWANRTIAQVKTDLGLTGTNSGDATLAGQTYLTIAGQVITANAVNLSGTHVTGTLAAARIAGTATNGFVATVVSGVPTWQAGSTGTDNTLIGAGYRPILTATQEVKTFFNSYGILLDSITNTNALTWKADTSSSNSLVTQYDLSQVSGGTPSVTATRVPYGDLSNLITTEPNFTWDATNDRLMIGAASSAYNLGINATLPSFAFSQAGTHKGLFGIANTTNDFVTGTAASDMVLRWTVDKKLVFSDDAARSLRLGFVNDATTVESGNAVLFQVNQSTAALGHTTAAFALQNLASDNGSRLSWLYPNYQWGGEIGLSNDSNFLAVVGLPTRAFYIGFHAAPTSSSPALQFKADGKIRFYHNENNSPTYTYPGQFDFKNSRFMFGDSLNIGDYTLQVHGAGTVDVRGAEPYIHFDATGVTTPFTIIPTTRVGRVALLDGTGGGLFNQGYSSGDNMPLLTIGAIGTTTPTVPAMTFRGYKSNGSGSVAALSGTEIIASFETAGTPVSQIRANGTVKSITGNEGAGKVWTSDASGVGDWATSSSGFSNPMTTAGDIIIGGSSGTPTRLAAGTNTFVLTMVSGSPAWAAGGGGGGLSGLTAGRVPFATSSTAIADDANLLWDNTNKWLGIGATPLSPLHVEKSNNAVTDIMVLNINSGSSTQARFMAQAQTASIVVGAISDNVAVFGARPSGSAYIYTAATPGLVLMSTAGPLIFTAGSTAEAFRFASASGINYMNMGGSSGSSDYGVRNNTGNLEWKNTGGSWLSFGNMQTGSTNTMGASGRIVFPYNASTSSIKIGDLEIEGIDVNGTDVNKYSMIAHGAYYDAGYKYAATGLSAAVIEIRPGGNAIYFNMYPTGTANAAVSGGSIPLTISRTTGILVNDYVNFSGAGSSGYGVRNSSGIIELKNSTENWIPFNKYNTATDADFTVTAAMSVVNLPTISANRNVTINAGVAGQKIIILNKNSAGFAWNISGTNVKDAADATVTSFVNDTNVTLIYDGTNWYKL